METKIINVVLLVLVLYTPPSLSKVNAYVNIFEDDRKPSFDQNFYKDALDPKLCEEQLLYITKNNAFLWRKFLEAGLRIPRSTLERNTIDMGNYQQCLHINKQYKDSVIEGKYCSISVTLRQSTQETSQTIDFNPNHLHPEDDSVTRLEELEVINSSLLTLIERGDVDSSFPTNSSEWISNQVNIHSGPENVTFRLSVCIPKTCTTIQGIDGLLSNITSRGFQYEDNFCRLNNDKPWVAADYVAIVIFSIIGLLTLMSTYYELWNIFFLKTDPKEVSTIYRSFSVYTNTRRMTTFASNADSLECVDGIRALSMMWVTVGHSFSNLPPTINNLDLFNWIISTGSMWITAAGPLSVDTFFVLSGLLLVYTTAGKLSSMKLVKNLHLFYLYRLLRIFPLLAAVILLQVSIFNRVSDGPYWDKTAKDTMMCRKNWWINFLYLQNYFSYEEMCLSHTWYIAADMQLYILSPLILFWVLSGNKRFAWLALTTALFGVLTCATVYNFIMKFPGATRAPARLNEFSYYRRYYYLNTLNRVSPFIVGMIFGYLLHQWKGKTLRLLKVPVISLWICVIILSSTVMYATEPLKNLNWDHQTVDSLINSFTRPAWAVSLGLIIFACVHGFGGPINWFLSLQIWKLPSRLSYGMYLFHLPIIHIIKGSALAPIFFSVGSTINLFLSYCVLSFIVSFAMTLVVDSPFSTLSKFLLGGGLKKTPNEVSWEKQLEDEKITIAISCRGVTATEFDTEKQV